LSAWLQPLTPPAAPVARQKRPVASIPEKEKIRREGLYHWKYVYELADPRDGKVFYVGSGKGLRIDQHEKETALGHYSAKHAKIKEIWDAGLHIEKRIVGLHLDRKLAYGHEQRLIDQFGLTNLTNKQFGGEPIRIGPNR
jgi:hypothetical protein